MLPSPNTTKSLRTFQELMGKKFRESEGMYYTLIDDLTQKLGDMDECGGEIPDFNIKSFPFIHDWEHGFCSSQEVARRLKHMDPREVAHKQLTRKLTNYMFENEAASEYIKGILPEIKTRICPVYERYLCLLTRYFEKIAEEDAKQIPLTWLEVSFQKDDSFETKTLDMPMNQVINYLDTFFLFDINKNGYFFGDNVIFIEEDVPNGQGERTDHWIFAPKAYVTTLKALYDIDNALDIESAGGYIFGIIKEYAV